MEAIIYHQRETLRIFDGNLKKELWRKSKSRWLCLRGGCLGETVRWRTHRMAGLRGSGELGGGGGVLSGGSFKHVCLLTKNILSVYYSII